MGQSGTGKREEITESGTDPVVAKPIDPAALISTVQEIAARGKGPDNYVRSTAYQRIDFRSLSPWVSSVCV